MAAPLVTWKMKNLVLSVILRKQCLTYRQFSTVKSSIKDILKQTVESDRVFIKTEGWLKSFRKQKTTAFFHLNDGSGRQSLQVVADPKLCDNLSYGSSVKVEGELVKSPGKGQALELRATHIEALGTCNAEDYPFKIKGAHSLDYIRGYPHLRARTDVNNALLRVRNAASMAIHKYFQENNYIFVHTPIITSNDCEGAGEVFHLQTNKDTVMTCDSSSDSSSEASDTGSNPKMYFGQPAYLTVSGQLHLEAIAGAFSKAYSFGPTFRAENSFGRHHLSEFYMVEGEIAFTENMETILEVMEGLVKTVTSQVVNHNEEDFDFFSKMAPEKHTKIINNLSKSHFERITYTDAVQLLEKLNDEFQFKVSWGCDLQKEHEKYLVKHFDNTPVFVTDFPATLKPFYARGNTDEQTVAAVDLLVPEVGELFGGSLREERYDKLADIMNRAGMTKHYEWYLDLRQFGSVPHGGFGMGFERYIQCLCGISNIKDTIPFPRWPQHCAL